MSLKEYKPGSAFSGVTGRTADVSKPAWHEPNRAKKGAPNVLRIVIDDTGVGQLGCYGSPINTPNLDALAADGLRYSNMHTTALSRLLVRAPPAYLRAGLRRDSRNAMSCSSVASERFARAISFSLSRSASEAIRSRPSGVLADRDRVARSPAGTG